LKNLMIKKRLRYLSLFLCLMGFMLGIQGCGGGDGSCSECDDPVYEPRLSSIEGIAYFPLYEGSPNPSYYIDGNYGIQVALHADDETVIEIQITGDSGYYRFDDVPQGYYFITAFAEEYDEYDDLYYQYDAESPDIDIMGGEIVVVDLYLEYAGAI